MAVYKPSFADARFEICIPILLIISYLNVIYQHLEQQISNKLFGLFTLVF